MRNAIFIFILLIAGYSAKAQSDSAFASVHYKLTHVSDTTWVENPTVLNYVLYLGKKLNCYLDADREERIKKTGSPLGNLSVSNVRVDGVASSAPTTPQFSPAQMEIFTLGNNIYSDADGKLTVMEQANGKLFAVADEKPAINWSIQPDTKDIMGLQCQKAVGDFRGRTYEVWVASQLPYSNGPWKLNGLPGLIIEAADTKKEVVFSFVSFENLELKRPLAISTLAAPTTKKEFKTYKDALERDRQAMSGSSNISGGTISMRGVPMSGPDGKPTRYRKMNNPIEIEVKK
jgi:GLPGLI family protein